MKPKKVVIAPDSFKGTMSSAEAGMIMEKAVRSVFPDAETLCLSIADGGEGFCEAYRSATGGHMTETEVTGPDGRQITASWLEVPEKGLAVIEMAAASGLTLMSGGAGAADATTLGTGQLILKAAEKGYKDILLGIGGSATTDGGIGAAAALGVKFLDSEGRQVPLSGRGLSAISRIDAGDIPGCMKEVKIRVACDVSNPLTGPDGSAHVFGPQKGADEDTVRMLDAGLAHLNSVLYDLTGKDRDAVPGMGAAGGICLSLDAFFDIAMESGIDLLLDAADFASMLEGADIVLTGEGRIDSQSLKGKAPCGIAARAKEKGIPVIVIAGEVCGDTAAFRDAGITAVYSTNKRAVPWETARKTAKEDLYSTCEAVICTVAALG
ncbi:MAG: glycerate kinase [Christensenellaceae bacterium]|nr:glycerate kinase [Christensenellaceae bacterium]